jgi:mitochondrial pyruvate carrier 2
MIGFVPRLQQQVASVPFIQNNDYLRGFIMHPAGPFTIHFWAPTAKWLISVANILDYNRPVEKMSVGQQVAVTATGLIWSRYATQITPVNYNLLSVNFVMGLTGIWHLSRMANHYYFDPKPVENPPPAQQSA